MIATIGSANIHHLIDIIKRKERRKNVFLLVKRTLRLYSLNIFPIYHTAVLAIVIILYIASLVLIYLREINLIIVSHLGFN